MPDLAPTTATDPTPLPSSYRALLQVPTLGRILLATAIARIAQAMVGVALVLFTLQEFGSPQLAGLVTFAALFPGLVVSPICGALLDRHGRTRLILLDYVVELVALALIGVLALTDHLPAPLLVFIATITSFTAILSHTGLRSLFPILVPRHLWERVNAVDSNGYVIATIVGPPLAAAMVAFLGGAAALIGVALAFGLAALTMIGVPDPPSETVSTGRLLVDSWQGVVYWWRNRTLRGLSFGITVQNLAFGVSSILIPVLVLRTLGGSAVEVGLVFAVSGVSGMISALLFGRVDSRGREWRMLVIPMLLLAPAFALVLPVATGSSVAPAGFLLLGVSSLLIGFLVGPMDIALFTVRQRRTDPAWMGRAFAVSMAFNFMGYPIGAAIGGALVALSLAGAVGFGVIALVAGCVLAAAMVPRRAPEIVSATDAAVATAADAAV